MLSEWTRAYGPPHEKHDATACSAAHDGSWHGRLCPDCLITSACACMCVQVRMKWTPFASLDYPGLIRLTQPADVQAQPQAAATAGGGGPLLQAPNSMPMMYVPAAPSSSGYPPACQHSYTQPQACVSSTPDLAKIRSGSTNINPSNQHLVPAAHSNGSGGPPTASNARSSGHAMHIGQPSPLSHRSSGGPPEVVQHQAYHPGFPPKRQSGPGVISMPAAAGGLVNSSSRASTPSASVAHQLARQNQHLQAKLQQQQLLQQQQHAQRNGHMNGGQLGAANVTSSLRTGAARVPPQFSHLIHNGVSSASSSGPGSPLLAAKASQASGPTSASSSAVSIAGGALSNGNSRHGSTCLPAPPFPTSSGLPAPLSASAHPIAVHVTAGNGYAANANRHASGSATPSTYWSSNPVPVAAPVMAAHAAQAQNAAHHSAGPSHAAGPSHMATAAPAGTHTAQVRSAWEADKQQAQGQGQPGRAVAQRAGGTQQTHGAVSRLAAAGQGQVAHGPDSNNTASGLSSPAASYICHTDSTGGSGQDAFGLSTGGCTDGLKSRGSAGVAGASGMSSTAALGLQRSNSSASTVVINDGILILPNDLEGGPQIVLEPRGAFRYLSLVQQKYLANLIRRRWTPFEEIATGKCTLAGLYRGAGLWCLCLRFALLLQCCML